jgi:hypothetical protein
MKTYKIQHKRNFKLIQLQAADFKQIQNIRNYTAAKRILYAIKRYVFHSSENKKNSVLVAALNTSSSLSEVSPIQETLILWGVQLCKNLYA